MISRPFLDLAVPVIAYLLRFIKNSFKVRC